MNTSVKMACGDTGTRSDCNKHLPTSSSTIGTGATPGREDARDALVSSTAADEILILELKLKDRLATLELARMQDLALDVISHESPSTSHCEHPCPGLIQCADGDGGDVLLPAQQDLTAAKVWLLVCPELGLAKSSELLCPSALMMMSVGEH